MSLTTQPEGLLLGFGGIQLPLARAVAGARALAGAQGVRLSANTDRGYDDAALRAALGVHVWIAVTGCLRSADAPSCGRAASAALAGFLQLVGASGAFSAQPRPGEEERLLERVAWACPQTDPPLAPGVPALLQPSAAGQAGLSSHLTDVVLGLVRTDLDPGRVARLARQVAGQLCQPALAPGPYQQRFAAAATALALAADVIEEPAQA